MQASPKRLAANRANAAKSTGPRTPEGKTRCAQNARKHGFTATRFAVVRIEDVDSVAKLRADLIAAYRPANSQELYAIERMAIAQQSLLRCAALEAELFSEAISKCEPSALAPHALAAGLAGNCDTWRLFLRYQAQSERLYRRAVEDYERIRSLRQEFPNKPIAAAELAALPETERAISAGPITPRELERRWTALSEPESDLALAPIPIDVARNALLSHDS